MDLQSGSGWAGVSSMLDLILLAYSVLLALGLIVVVSDFLRKIDTDCSTKYTHFNKDGKLQLELKPADDDTIIQGDAPSAINYHRIIGEDVDPVPSVTYASFNCPHGVFKCGDNVLCCDCKGFMGYEHPFWERRTRELLKEKNALDKKCARLKALLEDVWKFAKNNTNEQHVIWTIFNELEARIKPEGIE